MLNTQKPIVTFVNKQTLTMFEMQARKGNLDILIWMFVLLRGFVLNTLKYFHVPNTSWNIACGKLS